MIKRKGSTYYFIISSLLLIFFITGCSHQNKEELPFAASRLLMDTLITIKVYNQGDLAAAQKALDVMAAIDALADRYNQKSDIYRVNLAAGKHSVTVDDETFELIAEALKYSQLTGGALDISIGPLVDLWKIAETSDQTVPAATRIAEARQLVDYRRIILDEDRRMVFLSLPGASLDLGSVAKGYAVRKAAAALKQEGVSTALIIAGGNTYTLGKKPDGSLWKIGVQDPFKPEGIIAYVKGEGENLAVDTAGGYYRYREVNGQRFTHIINPFTGKPASDLESVTVVSDDPLQSDALATGIFVLGEVAGTNLAESIPGIGVLMVTKDKKLILKGDRSDLFEVVSSFRGIF